MRPANADDIKYASQILARMRDEIDALSKANPALKKPLRSIRVGASAARFLLTGEKR